MIMVIYGWQFGVRSLWEIRARKALRVLFVQEHPDEPGMYRTFDTRRNRATLVYTQCLCCYHAATVRYATGEKRDTR